MTFRRRQPGSRCGATAVEFALTAPIFFVFLMAAFEFGWLNVIRHTADNAAYEAARIAMVPGATASEARAKADSLLNIVGTRAATVTVNPATLTSQTERITVTIEVPMDSNGLIVPRFTKGKTLVASSTLRTERADGLTEDPGSGAPNQPAPEPEPEPDPPSWWPPPWWPF